MFLSMLEALKAFPKIIEAIEKFAAWLQASLAQVRMNDVNQAIDEVKESKSVNDAKSAVEHLRDSTRKL